MLQFPREDMGRIIGKAGATRSLFLPGSVFALALSTFLVMRSLRREIEEKSGAEVKASVRLSNLENVFFFIIKDFGAGVGIWCGQVRGAHHRPGEGKGAGFGAGW